MLNNSFQLDKNGAARNDEPIHIRISAVSNCIYNYTYREVQGKSRRPIHTNNYCLRIEILMPMQVKPRVMATISVRSQSSSAAGGN